MNKNKLMDPVKWAQDYIKEYNTKNDFIPLDFLDFSKKDVKIYSLCIEFLNDLDNVKENFNNTLNKYMFN